MHNPPRDKEKRQRSVCVFCGSSSGRDPRHAEAARELGILLAANGFSLVFGG
jgi:predicted Rossmann-fold nucleotide-binding protein